MSNEVKQRKTIKLHYQPHGKQGESMDVTICSNFESGNLGSAYFDTDNPIKVENPSLSLLSKRNPIATIEECQTFAEAGLCSRSADSRKAHTSYSV